MGIINQKDKRNGEIKIKWRMKGMYSKIKWEKKANITVEPNQEPSTHYWDPLNEDPGPSSKKLRVDSEVVNDDNGFVNDNRGSKMHADDDIEVLN